MVLLKERVFAVTSYYTTNLLFKTCSWYDVLFLFKKLEHQETIFWISYGTFHMTSSKILCIKLYCIPTTKGKIGYTVLHMSVRDSRLNSTAWLRHHVMHCAIHTAIGPAVRAMQQPLNLLYVWVPFSVGHPVQYSTIKMLIPTTAVFLPITIPFSSWTVAPWWMTPTNYRGCHNVSVACCCGCHNYSCCSCHCWCCRCGGNKCWSCERMQVVFDPL